WASNGMTTASTAVAATQSVRMKCFFMTTALRRPVSMPLEEHVVLPAAHAQQDLADQGDVMPVLGIDRDLRRGAERDLVARHVVRDVDHGQCSAALGPRADIHEASGRWHLASRDRVQDKAHLALEHAAG